MRDAQDEAERQAGCVVELTVQALARNSFEHVWSTHASRLGRIAMNLVDNRDDAAEVVQEAFTNAWRRWHDIDDHAAYLTRAVVNTSIDVQRRRSRRRRHEAHAHERAVDEQAGPAESLLMMVDRLPDRNRAVVVLRYAEDLDLAEIARVLEMPLGTVKSLLHRSLATLAKEFAP